MKGKNKLVICLLAFFFGWIGLDKIYFAGFNSKGLIFALLRLLSTIIPICLLVWVIIDLYQVIAKNRYKLDPRDYFK